MLAAFLRFRILSPKISFKLAPLFRISGWKLFCHSVYTSLVTVGKYCRSLFRQKPGNIVKTAVDLQQLNADTSLLAVFSISIARFTMKCISESIVHMWRAASAKWKSDLVVNSRLIFSVLS